jgi:hypothetical protein
MLGREVGWKKVDLAADVAAAFKLVGEIDDDVVVVVVAEVIVTNIL